MHWSWQRLTALKQRQLQLHVHVSFLIKEEKSAAVYPVTIPKATPQSAWICKRCLCCVLPGPLSCTKPKQHRVCPVTGLRVNLERSPLGPISCIPVKPFGFSLHLVSSSPAAGPWRKWAFMCQEEAQHRCKATGRDKLCRAVVWLHREGSPTPIDRPSEADQLQ